MHAKGLDAVRRDLIEDHKAFLAENAFNALIPALERFRTMRAGLNARRNRDTAAQLDAMIEILSLAVRSLGYLPFEPALGEPFDPQRMECVGHRKGSPGVVLGVERPGYASACGVKRAAGVLLASPAEPGRRTRI